MKRIVSLVLALSMVLGLCATAFASVNLTDVEGTKYEAAVEALIELEVVAGYPNGKYQPAKEVNRAELAKMLVICMGLEEDAERASGDNVFTDESLKDGESYAWARGYVNTAATAGIIKGYPTGEFKPEKTVTYAEALTMMLRALGYGNVMEAEGTWPTNAILKARELELTDDVTYSSSSDGATRGDIAILLWNMLRTPMWKISSENQGTGMTSERGSIMLNVKFPDYVYAEVTFNSYEIVAGDEMAEVEVTLYDGEELFGTYTYDRNDFYTFVEGTTVEVLVNTEDEVILTMVANGDDKLVDGKSYDLAEDKYTVDADADYSYLRIKGKKTTLASSEYKVESEYVEKVRGGAAKDDYITINGTRYDEDDDETRLVIVDGERSTMKEVELGDILTKVTLVSEENEDVVFYIVESSEVEGELTKYVVDESQGILTVDGEKYLLDDKATCIVDPEDDDSKSMLFTGDKAKKLYKDFKNEEVRLLNDAFGFVVRLEFGNLDEEEDTTYGFYKIVKYNKSNDTIVLENENGDDTYEMNLDEDDEGAAQVAATLANSASIVKNKVVFAEFNSSREVIDIKFVADKINDGSDSNNTDRLNAYTVTAGKYGKYEVDDVEKDKYEVAELTKADYNEKSEALTSNGTKYAYVDDDVVVVKLLTETTASTKKTTFACEFVEGMDELKVLDGAKAAYVVLDKEAEEDDGAKSVKYVFVFDDKTNSDMIFGKLAKVDGDNELAKDEVEMILEDGTKEIYVSTELDADDDAFAAFTVKENKDGDYELTVKGNPITKAHLNLATENHGYVYAVNGKRVTVNNVEVNGEDSVEVKLTATAIKEDFKIDVDDYRIVIIDVELDKEADTELQYVVDTFEEVEFEALDLEVADRISIDKDAKVAYIIRGMEEVCDCETAKAGTDGFCTECNGYVKNAD